MVDSTRSDPVQIPCESVQWSHLPRIYNISRFLDSYHLSHITCMTVTNHTIIHPLQDKVDTDRISIGVDNQCSVTMSYFKQDIVGIL